MEPRGAAVEPMPSKGRRVALLGAITVAILLGTVGTVLTPTLSTHHPLMLLALEARDRNLLLARHAAFVPFVVVGTLRKFSSDPLFFLLGSWYGEPGLRWVERHGGGSLVRVTERAFRRAAYPMLLIFPGAVVCTLAGAGDITFSVFIAITLVRTLVVVLLLRALGNVFAGPVDALLRFFGRYTVPLTVGLVLVVVVWYFVERRQANGEPEDREDDGDPWAQAQRDFDGRVRTPADLEQGTIVVIPSLSLPHAELRKITAIERYEERMLCFTLLADHPATHVVYVTSLPVDDDVLEYHLRLLGSPGARARVHLISIGDPDPAPLSEKLLTDPALLERIRAAIDDAARAYVLPFNVTSLEIDVARALGLPVLGARPELVPLGSKSGSRQVARRAGVAIPSGAEDLHSLGDLEGAIQAMLDADPGMHGVVVKLNNSFSGQGNALLASADIRYPLPSSSTLFCADEESWPSFAAKIEAEGAIVEELLRHDGLVSPSAQLRILPGQLVELISTHDQVLGGPGGQVYLGCRFPAAPEYRRTIQEAALAVGRVLAVDGVIGTFGIDFLVWPDGDQHQVRLSEINLRAGGTTHPFWMTRMVTGARFEAARGELITATGGTISYEATDNLKSVALIGTQPRELIDRVREAGLLFERGSLQGVTLHLLGALREHGKLGATCIAPDPLAAGRLATRLRDLLGV